MTLVPGACTRNVIIYYEYLQFFQGVRASRKETTPPGGVGFFQKKQITQGPGAGNPSILGTASGGVLKHANMPRQEEIPLNIAFGAAQLRILQQALVNLANLGNLGNLENLANLENLEIRILEI